MDAFAEEFLERCARHWKPTTLKSSTVCIHHYILPAFGHLTVDAIAAEDVRDWFASMTGRPGMVNRSLPVLPTMMKMAELWGYRPHNSNPCKNTKCYRMTPKERFLSAEEMARLNAVLTRDEFYCPQAVAVIRLLMLTGCRRGEAARANIEALPGIRNPDGFLFPRYAEGRGQDALRFRWRTVCEDAGLGRLRLHDLRHTAASHAVMSGENLPLVGRLLGHRRHRTTAGYAHLADAHLVEAAEKVGSIIAEAMDCDLRSRSLP